MHEMLCNRVIYERQIKNRKKHSENINEVQIFSKGERDKHF